MSKTKGNQNSVQSELVSILETCFGTEEAVTTSKTRCEYIMPHYNAFNNRRRITTDNKNKMNPL